MGGVCDGMEANCDGFVFGDFDNGIGRLSEHRAKNDAIPQYDGS